MKQQTHDQMKELLDQFSKQSINKPNDNANAAPSNRFPSKLANIVDRLDELGFTETQIEQAAVGLRYEITLENALDYLCLNIDTFELPPLFTEGSLREELNTKTTAESLVVVSNHGRGERREESREFETAAMTFPPSNDAKCETNVEDDKQKQKEWLLRQYEYEEGDQDEASNETEVESTLHTHTLSSEEQELLVKEKELKELQDDLANDANNYMRSKQEIKSLQIQAKKLKQQVDGLRRKVERIQRQVQQEKIQIKKEEEVTDNVEEEECGGFFDLFDESQQDNDKNFAEDKPHKEPRKLLNFTIPKGWTGTSPEKQLDEVCRKQKLPKPKYTKLPRLVCIIWHMTCIFISDRT
jgi:hypothetical protein